jgi:hypothetical protein
MNDLLARINELRRAQPDVMGDKEWFLSGSRVLLRQRRDWRDWTRSGLAFLFFGGIAVRVSKSPMAPERSSLEKEAERLDVEALSQHREKANRQP